MVYENIIFFFLRTKNRKYFLVTKYVFQVFFVPKNREPFLKTNVK